MQNINLKKSQSIVDAIYINFKWNIKSQQMKHNRNYIKHFFCPKQYETRNQL